MPGMNGTDSIEQNMSMLNPTDLTMMAQEKKFTGGMTIGDFLGKLGMSPEDPVEKLFDFGKKQVQNANPLNKAKNIASRMDNGMKNGQMNTPEMPQQGQGQGLDTLLQGA